MNETLRFSTDKKIRLDEFLRQELPAKINEEISNSKIRRLIVAGAVSVNNRQTARPSFELRGKSEITIELDRETSGVILFTKTRTVNKLISDIFQSHSFVKKYYAVVEDTSGAQANKLTPGQTFTVEMNMGRISSSTKAAKWGKVADGQYSKTDFKYCAQLQ